MKRALLTLLLIAGCGVPHTHDTIQASYSTVGTIKPRPMLTCGDFSVTGDTWEEAGANMDLHLEAEGAK